MSQHYLIAYDVTYQYRNNGIEVDTFNLWSWTVKECKTNTDIEQELHLRLLALYTPDNVEDIKVISFERKG